MNILIHPQEYERSIIQHSKLNSNTKSHKIIFVGKNENILYEGEKNNFINLYESEDNEDAMNSFPKFNEVENTIQEIPYNINFKGKLRTNYGKGPEFEKLNKYMHYKQPYEKCHAYLALGKPNKLFFNKLGEEYNKDFKLFILSKMLPKFTRNHKRNFGLAVWFFEDLFPFIYPWLKEKRLIQLHV